MHSQPLDFSVPATLISHAVAIVLGLQEPRKVLIQQQSMEVLLGINEFSSQSKSVNVRGGPLGGGGCVFMQATGADPEAPQAGPAILHRSCSEFNLPHANLRLGSKTPF